MARPPRHTPEEVLDLVLPVFWRLGFDRTTLADLERATGLGRQCLYNSFGDKAGMLRGVMDRYRAQTEELLEPLRRANAGLPAIAKFFERTRAAQKDARSSGCFAAKIAMDLPADPTLRGSAIATARAVRDAFAVILTRAAERGEIRDQPSPEAIADFLLATGNGAAQLAATKDGDAAAARVVSLALKLLAEP